MRVPKSATVQAAAAAAVNLGSKAAKHAATAAAAPKKPKVRLSLTVADTKGGVRKMVIVDRKIGLKVRALFRLLSCAAFSFRSLPTGCRWDPP